MARNPRILLMNMMPNTVGDSILITPMFRIIKKNYPNCFLAATVTPRLADLFRNNKYLDKIIVVDGLDKINAPISKIKKLAIYSRIILNLRKEIKKSNFDVCFIVHPLFFLLPVIPFLGGIKNRIGFKFKGSNLNFLLTKEVKFTHWYEDFDRHFIESYLDLLRAYNMKINKEDVVEEIFLKKKTIDKIKKTLREKRIGLKKGIVCFEAVSKFESKNWDYRRYGELANYLIGKGYDVLLFGSPAQKDANEKIRELTNSRAFNFAGEFKFDEIAAIFKLSKLFISPPSGLSQLAGAVGTPVLEIHGPSNPKHNMPVGKNKSYAVVYKDLPRPPIINFDYNSPLWKKYYNSITVKQVIRNIKKHKLI